MINPWLTIQAADYEGHMGSPEVDQLSFLSMEFKESLELYDCSSIALLGCATGNGLEHIKSEVTHRVTAVDINPEYLEILRLRYANSIERLEIIQADLKTCKLENQAYSLIFAGLLFEYLEPLALLQGIVKWLRTGGVLVTILQLPAEGANVTTTPYTSLKNLDAMMQLIDPKQFRTIATEEGLMAIGEKAVALRAGKEFYIGTYRKECQL